MSGSSIIFVKGPEIMDIDIILRNSSSVSAYSVVVLVVVIIMVCLFHAWPSLRM